MVSISHEIQITDLIQIHRRQTQGATHKGIDALPTFLQGFISGQERLGKVTIAPDTAHDFIERDILPFGYGCVFTSAEDGTHFIVVVEIGVAAGDARPPILDPGLEIGSAKMLSRL